MTTTINAQAIKNKAEKLHALTVRGIDGEKENAKKKLRRLVNFHPDILGAIYPIYLSRTNKAYGQNEPQKQKEHSRGYDIKTDYNPLTHKIHYLHFSLSELHLFEQILNKVGQIDGIVTMLHAGSGKCSTMLTGSKEWVWKLVSSFETHRKSFAAYIDTLTYSFAKFHGINTGDTPNNYDSLFSMACNGTFRPV